MPTEVSSINWEVTLTNNPRREKEVPTRLVHWALAPKIEHDHFASGITPKRSSSIWNAYGGRPYLPEVSEEKWEEIRNNNTRLSLHPPPCTAIRCTAQSTFESCIHARMHTSAGNTFHSVAFARTRSLRLDLQDRPEHQSLEPCLTMAPASHLHVNLYLDE